MRRRDFLKALATIATATATTDLSAYLPAPLPNPPTINWLDWNMIEVVNARSGSMKMRVNGIDVMPYRDIVHKVCRLFQVDWERECVTIGPQQEKKTSRMRLGQTYPNLGLTGVSTYPASGLGDNVCIGFNFKQSSEQTDWTHYDDFYMIDEVQE